MYKEVQSDRDSAAGNSCSELCRTAQSARRSSSSRTHSGDHQRMQVLQYNTSRTIRIFLSVCASGSFVAAWCTLVSCSESLKEADLESTLNLDAFQVSTLHKSGKITVLMMSSIISTIWECWPPRYTTLQPLL